MSECPLISIVMPSYNAESTIETALKSIRMQTVSDQIEILVIDGGSTDATRDIARRYGAVVLENPHRLPEPAKVIGMQQARGQYVIEQDTDEEWMRPMQVEERLRLFAQQPEVKCVVCDTQHPGPNGGLAAQYICACGDPFTQFVYQRNNGVYNTFGKKKESTVPDEVLHFQPGDPTPIGDGGTTMFDLCWVKQTFPDEWDDIRFVCAMANCIIQHTGCCGCIPGDDIRHHVKAGFRTYLSKLRFRVVNNLFHQQESGFSARAADAVNARFARRKYWFVIYAATVVGPLVDSIRMAVRDRDPSMLLHVVYVYYVCLYIPYCLIAGKLGKKARMSTYGK